jgi:hypothetical protein
MHISSIRASYERLGLVRDAASRTIRGAARLNVPVDESGGVRDVPPPMTPGTTSGNEEMALIEALTDIGRRDPMAVGIIATDPRDVVFLGRMVREFCPDARLFTCQAELLYARPQTTAALRGMLVATTYPLAMRDQWWTAPTDENRTRQAFPSEAAQGAYNAMTAHIAELGLEPDGGPPQLIEFGPAFPADGTDPDRLDRPPIWISVVGQRGLIPLGSVSRPDEPDDPIYRASGLRDEGWGPPSKIQRDRLTPLYYPGWGVLLTTAFVASLGLMAVTVAYWIVPERGLAPDHDPERRKSLRQLARLLGIVDRRRDDTPPAFRLVIAHALLLFLVWTLTVSLRRLTELLPEAWDDSIWPRLAAATRFVLVLSLSGMLTVWFELCLRPHWGFLRRAVAVSIWGLWWAVVLVFLGIGRVAWRVAGSAARRRVANSRIRAGLGRRAHALGSWMARVRRRDPAPAAGLDPGTDGGAARTRRTAVLRRVLAGAARLIAAAAFFSLEVFLLRKFYDVYIRGVPDLATSYLAFERTMMLPGGLTPVFPALFLTIALGSWIFAKLKHSYIKDLFWSPSGPRLKDFRLQLRLEPPLGSPDEMPEGGKELVVVADVRGTLHVRVFDGDCERIADTSESRMAKDHPKLRELRAALRAREMDSGEDRKVLEIVESIIDCVPGDDRSIRTTWDRASRARRRVEGEIYSYGRTFGNHWVLTAAAAIFWLFSVVPVVYRAVFKGFRQTFESGPYELVLGAGFLATYLLLVADLVSMVALWHDVRRVLRQVSLLFLDEAFDRLPRRVAAWLYETSPWSADERDAMVRRHAESLLGDERSEALKAALKKVESRGERMWSDEQIEAYLANHAKLWEGPGPGHVESILRLRPKLLKLWGALPIVPPRPARGEAAAGPKKGESSADHWAEAPAFAAIKDEDERATVSRWARKLEDLVAFQTVRWVVPVLAQIWNLAGFLVIAGIALLLAVTSYPFASQRKLILAVGLLLGLIAVGITYLLVEFNRDEVISRLSDTRPNRLSLDGGMISSLVTYVLPLLGFLAAISFDVGDILRDWLDPLFRLLD